ncbi:hypothetical protein EVA_12788 [gut metagenome]|uniref:Uncharacterized protein n=1 Tax=gut metagenome TaxID=749906 RepID=J9CGG6_9ZZZZ
MILAQFPNKFADIQNLDGIKTDGGFIQNNNLWIAQNGLCNSHPLLIAFGKLLNPPTAHIIDVGFLNYLIDLLFEFPAEKPLCFTHKAQIFLGGFTHIKRRLFRQIADSFFGLPGIFKNIQSVNPYPTLGCRKAASDHVHGG